MTPGLCKLHCFILNIAWLFRIIHFIIVNFLQACNILILSVLQKTMHTSFNIRGKIDLIVIFN